MNIFTKKLNKKGFTLAELLVVVAILAILIAIAVPIFTGMLNDARTNVENANKRAVRAAAVTKILTEWSTYGDATEWTATANVSANGDMTGLEISKGTAAEDAVAPGDNNSYDITVGIHSVDVTTGGDGN